VVRILEHLALRRGYPRRLRIDYGSEFMTHVMSQWAADHDFVLDFIQPGKPAQKSFIESFNRTYREYVLDADLFHSLDDVCRLTEDWRYRHYAERPQDALQNMTLFEYAYITRQALLGSIA